MIERFPPKPVGQDSASAPVPSKKTEKTSSDHVESSSLMMNARNKVNDLLKKDLLPFGSGRHKTVKLPSTPGLNKIKEAASKKLGG